jgi:hypothetical protein
MNKIAAIDLCYYRNRLVGSQDLKKLFIIIIGTQRRYIELLV